MTVGWDFESLYVPEFVLLHVVRMCLEAHPAPLSSGMKRLGLEALVLRSRKLGSIQPLPALPLHDVVLN
jgi:hypothetical protein